MRGWSRRPSSATPTAPGGRSSTSRPASSPTRGSPARGSTRSPPGPARPSGCSTTTSAARSGCSWRCWSAPTPTIRAAEQTIEVDHLDPAAAIRRLAELTFDHHESHPDFIRLVSIENIHRAEHIAGHDDLAGQNTPAIELIEKILERGRRDGSFARDIDAVDLHMMISAFCVFRIANRHTFGAIFDRDLTDAARRDGYRRMLGDMIVEYLRGDAGTSET